MAKLVTVTTSLAFVSSDLCERTAPRKGVEKPAMSMNVQAMRPREHTHFRAEVGRFGGMINSGHATAIPNATYGPASEGVPLWGEGSNSTEFLTRHKPELKSFGAGVPGYAGFKPHGKNPWTGKSTELFEPHLGLSGNSALDVSKQPYASMYIHESSHFTSTESS